MLDVTGELQDHLRGEAVDLAAVRELLDAAGHEERVAAVRSLGRAEQRRLYAAAKGFLPLRLVDLVAPEVPDLATVRHLGRNTLPAFRIFEKRFCRPPGQDPTAPELLYGFNFQSASWATGPGYYVARNDPERGEVRIDYREVPPSAPKGWPPIRRNEVGLSRFVYGFMVDTLRRVSTHVSVGRAARKGKDMNSWFVLARASHHPGG